LLFPFVLLGILLLATYDIAELMEQLLLPLCPLEMMLVPAWHVRHNKVSLAPGVARGCSAFRGRSGYIFCRRSLL
jgi:hypothetical protein